MCPEEQKMFCVHYALCVVFITVWNNPYLKQELRFRPVTDLWILQIQLAITLRSEDRAKSITFVTQAHSLCPIQSLLTILLWLSTVNPLLQSELSNYPSCFHIAKPLNDLLDVLETLLYSTWNSENWKARIVTSSQVSTRWRCFLFFCELSLFIENTLIYVYLYIAM